MVAIILSVVLVGGVYMIYKHMPKGSVDPSYFQGDLEILHDPNIPTY